MGLVYSRFEFNGLANPFYSPGRFELLIDGGIKGYKKPRPQFIQVSRRSPHYSIGSRAFALVAFLMLSGEGE